MSIASDLLERHLRTLVADPAQWQTLIADDIVWELAYAPALGHPARLTGRDEVIRHVAWFLGAVEGYRFIEPRISAFADPLKAVAQVKAEALIRPTGRTYRQEYVVFLGANGERIAHGPSMGERWTNVGCPLKSNWRPATLAGAHISVTMPTTGSSWRHDAI